MKAYLTRRYMFSASHRLHSDAMSEQENVATYGKCNNPHGHGHNYALEVTVGGPVDERTGMICNLADLDSFVRHEILDRFERPEPEYAAGFCGLSAHDGESFRCNPRYCASWIQKRSSGKGAY